MPDRSYRELFGGKAWVPECLDQFEVWLGDREYAR